MIFTLGFEKFLIGLIFTNSKFLKRIGIFFPQQKSESQSVKTILRIEEYQIFTILVLFHIKGDGRPSPFTEQFCEFRPERLYKHPNQPKWFISCVGGAGVKGICQRCGAHAELELNEDCQMCLYPGQSEQFSRNLFTSDNFRVILFYTELLHLRILSF